jgi:quercetin dioxygenase-like cupin family protein
MPFFKESQFKTVDAAPGITRRLVTAGEKTMAVRIALAKGSTVDIHTHPHEQVGFVLSGALHMTIGDETHLIKPGDSYAIHPNVSHGATAAEDSEVVDIFAPIREDYL